MESRYDDKCTVNWNALSSSLTLNDNDEEILHKYETCKILKQNRWLEEGDWKNKCFIMNCECGETKDYSRLYHESIIIVKTPGVDLHDGPDCRYIRQKVTHQHQNQTHIRFKFTLHCYCSKRKLSTTR